MPPKKLTPEQKRLEADLLAAGLRPGLSIRAGGMRFQPDSYDPDNHTAVFVAATEQPATVFDWERFDFVDEVLRMDGMELPAIGQVPLLDSHSRASVQDVLGSASKFSDCEVDGQAGKECLVSFSVVQAGRDAGQKVREGHITDVSVGYQVLESYYVPEGEKQVIKGKEYEGPLKVTTRWKLNELSLVPIGADSLAKVRAEQNKFTEVNDVNEALRKFLESRGLAADATDEQALEYMRKLASESDEARAEIDRLKAKKEADEHLDNAIRQAVEDAQRAERERIAGITDAVAVAGLDTSLARELIDNGVSIDLARARILDELKKRKQALGAGAGIGAEPGLDSRDKFRAAALDGLLMRSGVRVDKPAEGHREFRGRTLLEIAREALELAGVNTRGMSRQQLAGRALSPASSSDFPALMSSVAGRHLLQAYNEWPATWQPFVTVTDATDFKEQHAVRLSGSPDLMGINENGEYQTASFSDAQETYRVITKGRIVKLTRTMIINDDLKALARIPRLLGTAARRMESAAVYSLITSNPIMSDGKALFSSAHGNLAGTGAALSSGTLSAGRTAMRKQKGLNGEDLDITPAFLLVPVDLETDAEVLIRSTALPDDNKSAGVYNPWAGKLTPIGDPLLSKDSTTAYYLMAHPDQVPTIEVAYLAGEQQPYIEEALDFDSDALKIKVRHDFGAGLVDWVGIYKNPGA